MQVLITPCTILYGQSKQDGQPSRLSSWDEKYHGCNTLRAQTIPGKSLALSPWHRWQSRNSLQGGQRGQGAAEEMLLTLLAFLLVLRGAKWSSCSSPALSVGTGCRTGIAPPMTSALVPMQPVLQKSRLTILTPWNHLLLFRERSERSAALLRGKAL